MYTLFAMIGASPLRKEDRRLLTGAGRYLDDLRREGMLHLGVLRSVEAHARIVKIEASRARALAGVVAVWSAADLPEITKPIGTASTGRPFAQPVLVPDIARYAGEPVAVVIAESAYRVADALELIEVEYDPLPPIATLEEAARARAPLHEGWPDNAALSVRGAVGETEGALGGAAVVVHAKLRHPRLAAVPIEPRGALAYRDAETGALVVWSSHQNPYRLRDAGAPGLGLPADGGAYPAEGAGLTANTVNHLPGPYRVPNYRALGTSLVTTKTVNAAYRGAGRPEAVFVMERLLDLGARRLGLDPAELRRRNLVRPEEMPYRPGLTYKDGVPVAYDPGDFPHAFERALGLLCYDDWRKRQKAQALTPRRTGVGLACYVQGTGLGPFEGALVRVDPSGEGYVLVGVAAQGQGHATTLAQIAASELGAAFDDVIVSAGDTTLFPFGMGTGGSPGIVHPGPPPARTARQGRGRAAR